MTDTELLQEIHKDMHGMKQDMNEVKQDLAGVKQDLAGVKQDLTGVKQDLTGVKQDLSDVKQDLHEVKQRVTSLEVTLENETNRNIKLIAEGHLDLSRKLDDALRIDNEKEMLLIRVNSLENELRKVKERLNSIA